MTFLGLQTLFSYMWILCPSLSLPCSLRTIACAHVWILCLCGIRKSLIHTMCTASVIYKSGIKNSLGAHVDIILFSLFSVSCPGAWCRPGDTGVSLQSVWWGGTRKQWSDCGVCLHSLQIGISYLWQGRSENSRITLHLCSNSCLLIIHLLLQI